MNWRRIADVFAHRAGPPDDERSIKAKHLAELEADVQTTNAELRILANGARDRLASYRRARIGR